MKKVKLISDYTPLHKPNALSILKDDDGDFHFSISRGNDRERGVRVAQSGSRYSGKIRKILSELMDAIEEENISE